MNRTMNGPLTWKLSEIDAAAGRFLEAYGKQRIFAFYGGMGIGKTTFIKALCRRLGVTDQVSSPTFALINEYGCGNGTLIHHFDFYRIEDRSEIFDLGYEDYFFSGSYCFIEWPEIAEELLPGQALRFRLEQLDRETRMIRLLGQS